MKKKRNRGKAAATAAAEKRTSIRLLGLKNGSVIDGLSQNLPVGVNDGGQNGDNTVTFKMPKINKKRVSKRQKNGPGTGKSDLTGKPLKEKRPYNKKPVVPVTTKKDSDSTLIDGASSSNLSNQNTASSGETLTEKARIAAATTPATGSAMTHEMVMLQQHSVLDFNIKLGDSLLNFAERYNNR